MLEEPILHFPDPNLTRNTFSKVGINFRIKFPFHNHQLNESTAFPISSINDAHFDLGVTFGKIGSKELPIELFVPLKTSSEKF